MLPDENVANFYWGQDPMAARAKGMKGVCHYETHDQDDAGTSE